MSCSQYFSEKYGEKINNLDQPLVRCKGYMKETVVNGDKVR